MNSRIELVILLLVAFCPDCPRANGLDFSRAVVVACGSGAELPARVLAEEIELRAGRKVPVVRDWPGGPAIFVATGDMPQQVLKSLREKLGALPEPGREGFRLVVRNGETPLAAVMGVDRRGTLFGVGRLLRNLEMRPRNVHAVKELAISTSPSHRIRGVQITYHPMTNTYDAWTPEQFERYVRDLIFFGANCVEILASGRDARFVGPLMKLPPERMMVEQARILQKYGLDVWLFYPNRRESYRDSSLARAELEARAEVFRSLPRLDHVFVPGGDPGDLPPEEFFPWLRRVASVLHEYHPEADVWVSPQNPRADRKWLEAFVDSVNAKPEWLGGVVYGPWVAMSLPELREKIGSDIPIRRYPDITHTISCQYPVWRWDLAFALTLGREPINPRPVAEKHIENVFHELAVGTIAYSEGINDDVNKFVWLGQNWDPQTPVICTLRDYARLFIDPGWAESIAQGLLALERNWEGPLIANSSVEVTLAQWQDMEREAPPHVVSNYRFQMGLLRAYYDAYVRRRLLYETELEKEALEALAAARDVGAERAVARAEKILLRARTQPVAQELKRRCWQLADSLFKSIGAQLSVERYGAISRSRGAFLDAVDEPLNDVRWLLAQFERVRRAGSERERLRNIHEVLNRTNPGPGGFYDNLGTWGSWQRVVPGVGWDEDPGTLFSPRVSFGAGLRGQEWVHTIQAKGFEGQAVPLAWLVQATGLYDTPLTVRYENLDPRSRYRLRVAYTGRFRSRIKLVADNSIVVHDFIQTGEKPLWEFEIPPEATRDGELVVTWTCPEGERGAQVAELWLIGENSGR